MPDCAKEPSVGTLYFIVAPLVGFDGELMVSLGRLECRHDSHGDGTVVWFDRKRRNRGHAWGSNPIFVPWMDSGRTQCTPEPFSDFLPVCVEVTASSRQPAAEGSIAKSKLIVTKNCMEKLRLFCKERRPDAYRQDEGEREEGEDGRGEDADENAEWDNNSEGGDAVCAGESTEKGVGAGGREPENGGPTCNGAQSKSTTAARPLRGRHRPPRPPFVSCIDPATLKELGLDKPAEKRKRGKEKARARGKGKHKVWNDSSEEEVEETTEEEEEGSETETGGEGEQDSSEEEGTGVISIRGHEMDRPCRV
jgi:hypothetical protein